MEDIRRYIERLVTAGLTSASPTPRLRAVRGRADGIYTESLAASAGATFFVARLGGVKQMICWGNPHAADCFSGVRQLADDLLAIPCTADNAAGLHARFPFTKPIPVADRRTTLGTGDRIGLAAPGHVAALAGYEVTPVLAQQSVRELSLTGRTFPEVVAAASWGAFETHWTCGYAADGDHLKTAAEIGTALGEGATMITLDCSDHIDATAAALSRTEALAFLRTLPDPTQAGWAERYIEKEHVVTGTTGTAHRLRFTAETVAGVLAVYGRALAFTREVFRQHIAGTGVDFELSIDETPTPTGPAAHYLIAAELQRSGVGLTSLAPRFCGRFEKGIDYLGDLASFKREFAVHAAIAECFGHKLSIHSGSDKFAVYPLIGRYTQHRVHVKTAGTSWLEALRLIAAREPALFRDIHACARACFSDASLHYHVSVSPERLTSIESLADAELPAVLDDPGHRQLLHITYASILTGGGHGAPRALDIVRVLEVYEDEHAAYLERHIGKHLEMLGVPKRA